MSTGTTPVTRTPPPLDPQLRRVAVVVVLGAIMTILDTTIVNVAVATLGRSFHASLPVVQWTLTGYALALSLSIPVAGWAVRRYGSKAVWLLALTLFVGGSVLCGAAWSIGSLVAFRVVQGIGGGMVIPVGQTLLARAAGPDRMGRVLSVLTVPAMLAPMLGPLLGGLIVAHASWRWIFFVNVPLGALAILLAVRTLPDDRDAGDRPRFDAFGLALLSPGLAALGYGLVRTGEAPVPSVAATAAGVALLTWFTVRSVRRSRHARPNVLDVTVLRRRGFGTAMSALFLYSAAVFGLLVILPVYYQTVRGASPLLAGLLVAPLGLGAIVTTPPAGRIVDRRGPRGVAVAGLGTAALGLIAYTRLTPGTSPVLLAAALFVVGLGHGLISPSLMAAALNGVDRAELPVATTAANILARLGTSFGTAAFAVILQAAIRSHVPGAGGRLDEAALRSGADAAARLTAAFADSLWWVLGLTVVAVVPAVLVPARRYRQRAR